jgi:hypothetical protein
MRKTALPLCLVVSVGCAVGGPEPKVLDAEILALSTDAASLGAVIELYGENLPGPEDGRVTVVFEGEFTRSDGRVVPVDLEVPVDRADRGTLRWTGFGPFAVPFDPLSDATGVFRGTVKPRLTARDGEALDGPPTDATIEVLPSIVVRDLQPLAASCADPARLALGGLSYRIEVEAIGFDPGSFTYTIRTPMLGDEPLESVRHIATGPTASLGDDGSLVLPMVPEDVPAYAAVFVIESQSTSGATVATAFATGVHRPMEIFYNGNVEIAEIMAPIPVSGCIPGGEAGRNATYEETMTETRARSFSVNWDENWLRSTTVGRSTSTGTSVSEQNSVQYSSTDGRSWNWQVGTEVGGGGSLFGLIEASMKVNGHVGQEFFSQETTTVGRTTGLTRSQTTTDTVSATEAEGGSHGEEFSWDVSSSETLARDFSGHVIAGTQGVFYRQTMRLMRRAAVVTYNLCGISAVVGEVDFQDWTWSADLALAHTCPPLPTSNLPEAQCLIEPCGGE